MTNYTSATEFKTENTERYPPIKWCIILATKQNFWGRICKRSTVSFFLVEICCWNQSLSALQDLVFQRRPHFGFKSQNHGVCTRYMELALSKVLLGQVLIKSLLMLHYVVEHVSSILKFQDKVELGLGVNHYRGALHVGVLH